MPEIIQKLLLERLSLRGICRILNISLTWLMEYIVTLYTKLPDHLYVQFQVVEKKGDVVLNLLEAQADEIWSFVGNKGNKQWVWIAIDAHTKQVIAFYVGDRSSLPGGRSPTFRRRPGRQAAKALKNFGKKFLIFINATRHFIRIIGKPIKALFQKINIKQSQSNLVKHRALSVLTYH